MKRSFFTKFLSRWLSVPTAVRASQAQKAYDNSEYAAALKDWLPLARDGNASAQHNVGAIYYNGEGVPQDYCEAAEWFAKAAKQGNAGSQYALGIIYTFGGGMPQDYVHAHMCLSAAIAQGHEQARKDLAKLTKKMTCSQITEAENLAHPWFADT